MKVSLKTLREELSDLLGKVQHAGARIVIDKYNKPIAAIVPYDEYEYLLRVEDDYDIKEARQILDDEDEIVSWDEAQKELSELDNGKGDLRDTAKENSPKSAQEA